MRYPRRINPRSKPRIKGRRDSTEREPVQHTLPPLPPPSKEEMGIIVVNGKEYQALVKTYPHVEVAPDQNPIKLRPKGVLEVLDY